MRLVSVDISGFRGFPRQQEFDVDADAIVVMGANGHGKTSLFDGILWALCGRIPRLCKDDASLVSMYADGGQARVAVRLKDAATSRHVTVVRSFDGTETRVALEGSEGSFQGPAAEARLIELVWPPAASSADSREALASVLTRSFYLQQDSVRQFVEAASDQDRFSAVSELVGAGRVTELQGHLERSKKAWTAASNQRQAELSSARDRLSMVESRLSELVDSASQAVPGITPEAWTLWWREVDGLGVTVLHVDPASRDAGAAIDKTIKQLEALRQATERRHSTLCSVRTQISEQANRVAPDVGPLRVSVDSLTQQLDDLKRAVTTEQDALAETRRLQAALGEKTAQLRILATIALKHLESHCPVCAQSYDRDATRARLESMVKSGMPQGTAASPPEKLPALLTALAAKEKERSAAENTLRSALHALNEQQAAQKAVGLRLAELGLTGAVDVGSLSTVISEAETTMRRIVELQRGGESLALGLARSSTSAAIIELRSEAEALRRDCSEREKDFAARNQTGEQAQGVIEALREAASSVVEDRLREIGPLLQSIYARIDPHPAFRFVSFLSRIVRGKGLLSTVVSDPIEQKESNSPAIVLSSSQVNALAVSVFLAMSIGAPQAPLPIAILDDPLQSLDDINLLGLVELLRRVKGRRQLFISTHDARFGNLLGRKLRPSGDAGRTVLIELDSWSRRGPVVVTREIKSDPVPLRLVAS